MELKIPTENHGKILVPDFSDIPAAVEKNERIFANTGITVAEITITDFRAMVRNRIKGLLGIDKNISQPIMLTAHQPGLWHPGIVYKHAVAKRFAGDYFLLSLNVDSDVVSPVSCKVPFTLNDKFGSSEVVILENNNHRIIQMLEKPSKEKLDEIFFGIEDKISTLPDETVMMNFGRFFEIHDFEYTKSATFSHWLTNCRREYFPVKNLHELDLSEICDTDEFRLFVWDIIHNCEKFFEIYNTCLDEYRAEHKIRYSANPFPNLEHRTENNIELPFWLINKNGQRVPMCVNCENKSILADHKNVLDGLTKNSEPSALGNFDIRPKALVLTMFMRMFAGSIFIHGIGGGNYDEVTDAVIRGYYGCEPPTYIVATRTEFLPVGSETDIDERIKQAKQQLRNMQFNPDEYIDGENPFAVEKRNILTRSKDDTTKQEYRRLKQIRSELVKEIKSVIDEKERKIELLEQKKTKVEQVRRRDFPYFFYPMELLED